MIRKEVLSAKFEGDEVSVKLIKDIIASEDCLAECKVRFWEAFEETILTGPVAQVMMVIGEVAARGNSGLISVN